MKPRYSYGLTKGSAVPTERPDRLTSELLLVTCPDCNGYGAQGEKVCKTCGGGGRIVAHCEEDSA